MNKKKRCPKCNRMLRLKCFTKNKLTEEEVCIRCDKKIGSNKFYSEELSTKRNNFISKYSITDTEKKVLRGKGVNVKRLCKDLKSIKERSKKQYKKEKLKERLEKAEGKELNKKFIEGLK